MKTFAVPPTMRSVTKVVTQLAMSVLLVTSIVTYVTAAESFPAGAAASAAQDPTLHAMQTELDREKDLLLLSGMQRPYFIQYRLDDLTSYEAVASYGALTREESGHQRITSRVTVRVGDYTLDSSSSRGDGVVELAPSGENKNDTNKNDSEALRYALWTATDTAYKNALRAYSAKQAALKQFQSAQAEHDFAPAKPVVQLSPVVAPSTSTAPSGSIASSKPAGCSLQILRSSHSPSMSNTPLPMFAPSPSTATSSTLKAPPFATATPDTTPPSA